MCLEDLRAQRARLALTPDASLDQRLARAHERVRTADAERAPAVPNCPRATSGAG
jgi:hypothetical protein